MSAAELLADDSAGGVADALMVGVGSDYRACVEYWRDRAGMAEQELAETRRLLADSEIRRVELEGLYAREVAAACTARAAVEASRGNR